MNSNLNRKFDIINIVPFNTNKIEFDTNITKFLLPLYSPNNLTGIPFVNYSFKFFDT
jgi:hypothetical protein